MCSPLTGSFWQQSPSQECNLSLSEKYRAAQQLNFRWSPWRRSPFLWTPATQFSQHPWRVSYKNATGPQKTTGKAHQQCAVVLFGSYAGEAQEGSEKGQLAKQLCREGQWNCSSFSPLHISQFLRYSMWPLRPSAKCQKARKRFQVRFNSPDLIL